MISSISAKPEQRKTNSHPSNPVIHSAFESLNTHSCIQAHIEWKNSRKQCDTIQVSVRLHSQKINNWLVKWNVHQLNGYGSMSFQLYTIEYCISFTCCFVVADIGVLERCLIIFARFHCRRNWCTTKTCSYLYSCLPKDFVQNAY